MILKTISRNIRIFCRRILQTNEPKSVSFSKSPWIWDTIPFISNKTIHWYFTQFFDWKDFWNNNNYKTILIDVKRDLHKNETQKHIWFVVFSPKSVDKEFPFFLLKQFIKYIIIQMF